MDAVPVKEKKRFLILKLTEFERSLIQKKAKRFAAGNVSAWIRFSAINFKPSRKKR